MPSFELNERRIVFEGRYLQTLLEIDDDSTVHVLHLDEKEGVLVTEFLTHALTLRAAMLEDKKNLKDAFVRVGEICAKAYFHTSEFGSTREERENNIRRFQGNYGMRDLTADVIFTSPWLAFESPTFPNNFHPLLRDIVKSLQNKDHKIKCMVSVLKHKFLTSNESLIHGDLHTGSIFLAGDHRVRIFDSEFCMMGPVSFDLGLLLAHILISTLSARHRSKKPHLEHVKAFWSSFCNVLTSLWERKHTVVEDSVKADDKFDTALPNKGNIYTPGIFLNKESREEAREDFFDRVFREMCGFAGISMIRRCIGVVSVEDISSIKNERRRVECECDVIRLARSMILNSDANLELRNAIKDKRVPTQWNMSRLLHNVKTILSTPCRVSDDQKMISLPWKISSDNDDSDGDAKEEEEEEDEKATAKNLFEIRGDLLKADDCQFIVHQTNCMTSHALGLAKHIFKRWPHADVYNERQRVPGGMLLSLSLFFFLSLSLSYTHTLYISNHPTHTRLEKTYYI